MNTDFEPAMAALFAHLQGVASFASSGRRVLHWQQVSAQPALFLRRVGVTFESDGSQIATTLECEAWIYANSGISPDAVPDAELTVLEKAVLDSLRPTIADDEGRFTLGGTVYWCRAEGRADISSGDQGPQAIARIPIRITLP